MTAGIVVYMDTTERKQADEALRERIKELNCLYGISSLLELPGISLDEILKRTVMLIPPALQFSEITEASIELEGKIFQTAHFRETLWMLAREIIVNGNPVGQVKVCYLEERQANDEGPFLEEERKLVNAISERLGRITERKRAEEELRETKNFLENLTDYANVPIIVWDPQFHITRFNHAFESLTGRTAGDVMGNNLEILFPPALVQRSMQLIEKTLHGERWETVEINILHVDGSVRTVLWNSANITDPQGNIVATIAQGHDITERKQAEERLFNSKATLIMAIDGISDPLFMLDAELRVKRLNRAARDYYGLTGYQEAIGKLCFEARGKSSPCEGCEHPFSDMRGYSGSYERKGAMDPDRLEQVFVDVVKDESGAPEASIVRIYDITQARMMDRQLIQSEKLASLGMLIAGIAHEINNPNNFIFFNTPILRSYLQFLLPIVDEYVLAHPELMAFGRPYSVFREDCFKLLDNIAHGSTRINQIVGNLREFVRERGKGETRQIDLKQVVEKGISICLGRIKKIVKTFEVNIPEGLPTLFTDPLAIEQVVVNLLINAAQAADKNDSWVRLTITSQNEPEGEVIVEVSDNGCGMDAETQKKIFDPFFTTKAVGVGTGLGMSISYRLVAEMRGRIEVWSEVGKGSIFRVILKT